MNILKSLIGHKIGIEQKKKLKKDFTVCFFRKGEADSCVARITVSRRKRPVSVQLQVAPVASNGARQRWGRARAHPSARVKLLLSEICGNTASVSTTGGGGGGGEREKSPLPESDSRKSFEKSLNRSKIGSISRFRFS